MYVGHERVKTQMYTHTDVHTPALITVQPLKTASQIQTLSILHPTSVLNIPHRLKIKVNTLGERHGSAVDRICECC